MTIRVADSFPPGRPWPGPPGPGEPPPQPGHPRPPGAPGWPAPHREPPGYPVVPPSRVWTDQGDWPGGLYQRLLERRIVMASGLLDGQVALITGGATGIGYGIAELLSTLGAHVVLAGAELSAVLAALELTEGGR